MINMNSGVNVIRFFNSNNYRSLTFITQLLPSAIARAHCNYFPSPINFHCVRRYTVAGLSKTSVQLKKKSFKKKYSHDNLETLTVSAFCTAEEYDLEALGNNLPPLKYNLSNFGKEFVDSYSVIHLCQDKENDVESKDAFIFREGAIVLWNFDTLETKEILSILKGYEINTFNNQIITNENEIMPYLYSSEGSKTLLKRGKVFLTRDENEIFDKYSISNAMAMSVTLGAYESLLEDFIHGMLPVTEDLKCGKKIKMTKNEVLKKMGELFSLRHVINLSSDLLDTPDFYWEHEELERLFRQTFYYFNISIRTKVMNERINHCIELVELLSSQISDSHHIRLEWMIIVLIMVEVMFEFFHYAVTYLN